MKKAVWSGALVMTILLLGGSAGAQEPQQPPKKALKRVEAQFKKLDANKDGGISREEWKRRPKAFDRLDADHNGSLSARELQRALRKARRRRG